MNKEKFSLKDQLFNERKLLLISDPLKMTFQDFDKKTFEKDVLEAFPNLELKQRMYHIRECLKKYLPDDFRKAAGIILSSLPEPLDENKSDNDFGEFIYAPYADFIAVYGCKDNDLEFSFNALKEITKRFSVEFAIRTFINNFPEETIKTISLWAEDSNYHVRRLASEGTRPKLPWAEKINLSPEDSLPILDKLFYDKTRFVTRSVANHLNDISKINPYLVLETLERWQSMAAQSESEMKFIIKHALRTLVKSGNKDAMCFLGHHYDAEIEIVELNFPKEVNVGDTLIFSFDLISDSGISAVVDYLMYFNSKSGKMTNKKVYKIKTLSLNKGKKVNIVKNHPFKENMSTRNLYPGSHRIEIQVNGEILVGFDFELKA